MLKTLGSKDKPIASLRYVYDADGTLTAREINGKLQTYEYDLKGQLIAAKDREGNILEKYEYDPAGNILKKIVNGKETIFSYDKANQLVSSLLKTENLPAAPKFAEANAGGTLKTDYQYDGAGRLISETSTDSTLLTASTKSYTYGWLDKVISVTENGDVSNFEYYPDGQLAEINVEQASRLLSERFYWDNLALIKRNDINYTIEPHVNGGSPILTTENTDHTEVLFNDILGSSLGTVKDGTFNEISRTSFGQTDNCPLITDDFYTGKPNIPELGYAFLFRNYRPELGKWQTSDPLGYPDGWNNLAYCNNWVTMCYDWLGAETYVCFDVEGFATGDTEFGHVEMITHDPEAETYTSFSHSHGQVYESTDSNWENLVSSAIDIVFVIPDTDSSDAAIDSARKSYTPEAGDSTYGNNCMTSVMDILDAASYGYPDYEGLLRTPNNWLKGFWNAEYGYTKPTQTAVDWIRINIYGQRPE